jgi:transposase
MNKRKRRSYTDEFKKQIVKLYKTGKKVSELSREYEMSEKQANRWIHNMKIQVH